MFQGSRIDERLEDAVNILQRHAETSGGGAQLAHHPGPLPPYPPGLDPQLAGAPNNTFTSLTAQTQHLKNLTQTG